MTTTPDDLEKRFWKALKSDRTMMLGLDGVEDGPRAPMTALFEDEAGPIWIFTARDNGIVQQLAERHRAIATFASKGHDLFATVHGSLVVDNDRAVIDRLWNPFVAAWYEGGKDDPEARAAAPRRRAGRDLARRLEPGGRRQDAAGRRPEEGLRGQGRRSAADLRRGDHS